MVSTTRLATPQDLTAAAGPYDHDAVIPTIPQPATLEILERYAAEADHPASLTIEFAHFDDHEIDGFRALEPYPGTSFTLYGAAVVFTDIQWFTPRPDAVTTTLNQATGRTLGGVHIDDLLQRPDLAREGMLPRKLGVILGPGEHIIGFGFADELERQTGWPRTQDVRQLAASGITFTCLWVRLHKGDGWCSPAAVKPHFGSGYGLHQHSGEWFAYGHLERQAFPPLQP